MHEDLCVANDLDVGASDVLVCVLRRWPDAEIGFDRLDIKQLCGIISGTGSGSEPRNIANRLHLAHFIQTCVEDFGTRSDGSWLGIGTFPSRLGCGSGGSRASCKGRPHGLGSTSGRVGRRGRIRVTRGSLERFVCSSIRIGIGLGLGLGLEMGW